MKPLLISLLLLATTPFIGAAEKKSVAAIDPAFQRSEKPPTPEADAWLAHQIVSAQVNDQAKIAQGLLGLLGSAAETAACAKSGVFVFLKQEPGEKAASIYRRIGVKGKDERLVDVAKMDGKESRLSILDLSADGNLLAYGVQEGAAVERTVHFYEMKTGRLLPDVLPLAHYHTATVGPENKGVFYSRVAPAGTRVFFHTFGETGEDKYVFGEMYNYEPLGPKDLISTALSEDGDHLMLSVRRGEMAKRTDLYVQEQEKPNERMRPIIHALDNEFTVVADEGDLFALTDNGAAEEARSEV